MLVTYLSIHNHGFKRASTSGFQAGNYGQRRWSFFITDHRGLLAFSNEKRTCKELFIFYFNPGGVGAVVVVV